MSTTTNQQTPEEVLNSIVEGINSGNIESLMTLYEHEACFAVQPGQIAKGQEGIRQSLQGFIDMKGKLALKVKRVLHTSDLALVISECADSRTVPGVLSSIILGELLVNPSVCLAGALGEAWSQKFCRHVTSVIKGFHLSFSRRSTNNRHWYPHPLWNFCKRHSHIQTQQKVSKVIFWIYVL
jgi:hypothetical protein